MRSRLWSLGLVVGLLVPAAAGIWAGTAQASSWLGVYSQAITPELREGMGYNGSGVLLRSVVDGSPADRAGLERGDVIVRVGARDIRTPSELASAVRAHEPGRRVAVEVVRDGRRRAIDVTLEERPGDSSAPDVEDESDDEGWSRSAPAPRAPRAPRAPVAPTEPDAIMDLDEIPGLEGLEGLGGLNPSDLMASRGRLGVRIETLSPDLASYFGGRDVRGALVVDVVEGSAADRAGIRAGDVITRVNSETVAAADELVKAIQGSDADASITIIRHGARQTLDVRLNEASAPRILRLRGAPKHGFEWQSRDGKRSRVWSWDRKDGTTPRKRIVIRGDGHHNEHHSEGDEELRRELEELREELKQLREELRK